ncbi:MAG: 30S ribosomal protein S16 [Saprospiraceae bacterium]
MSVRIRLQRHGRKQSPLYHIVIADARSPRDGSFIERIGTYNPMTRPATIDIDRMKAYEWLKNGAQPTETVNAILRFKGVLFYKHLQRGVAKGSFTAEEAEIKFRGWVDDKESRIESRVKATAAEKKARATEISGTVKKAEKKKEKVEHKADELLNVTLDQPTPQAEEVKSETPVITEVKPEAPEVVAEVPETINTESTPEAPAENTGEAGE